MTEKRGSLLKMGNIKLTFEETQRLKAITTNRSAELGVDLTTSQTAQLLMRAAIRAAKIPKN